MPRSTFGSQHVTKTRGSDHFWTIPWRFDVEKVYAVVARSTLGGSTYPRTGGFGLLCDDSMVMREEEEEEEEVEVEEEEVEEEEEQQQQQR